MDFNTAVIGLVAAVLTVIWIYRNSDPKYKRIQQEINKLPGPISLPVIGTAYKMFTAKRQDVFHVIDEVSKQYWPIFRSWNGPVPEVNFSDPDHIQMILRSTINIEKGIFYDLLHPWLGTGLLTSAGQKWHSHRKLITPTFHFKILESFREVFAEKSQILVEKLEEEVGNKGFDVYPYITRCALDIICETAMGTAINAQDDTHSPYVSAVYDVSELTIERAFRPWLHSDFIYNLTKNGKRYKDCLNILHTFSKRVIQERKQNAVKVTRVQEESDILGKKKRMVFLDLLLEASEGGTVLTDEEIREEVDTFMFEGHDTTSASLCWILFLLGNHQEVQEAVYEEQAAIFRDSDRSPTTQDLSEMKYLERVIQESLRLYPSVPFITRSLLEDIQIGEYTIPEGCQVTVHIYHVHRNPKYFPSPDTFNPDNFLPENVQGRHPYAYIPFSAGSRNCIGQRFALLEEKTVLSAIVRRFRVRALDQPSEIKLTGELVLRPVDGIRLTLQRR